MFRTSFSHQCHTNILNALDEDSDAIVDEIVTEEDFESSEVDVDFRGSIGELKYPKIMTVTWNLFYC